MKRRTRNVLSLVWMLLTVCTLIVMVSCGNDGQTIDPAQTETPTGVAQTTDATEADVTTQIDGATQGGEETQAVTTQESQAETLIDAIESEALTQEGQNETETSAETQATTEAEATEAQTEIVVMPEDAPTKNNVVTFCDFSKNDELFSGKTYEAQVVADGEQGNVLKVATKGDNLRSPYVSVDYAAYMAYADLTPVAWNDCGYAVVTLKIEGVSSNQFDILIKGQDASGGTSQVRGSTTYSKAKKDYQTVVVPLVETPKDGFTLSEIRIYFVASPKAEGETVYISSITFTSDKGEVAELKGEKIVNPIQTTIQVEGLKNEYTFLHVTDLHASAFSTADTKNMTQARINLITARRNAFKAGSFFSEERMPYMFSYADKINADLLLLTGDILDFPSQKNVQLLRDNLDAIKTPSMYILGNHDWCYGDDDYFSANAIQTQIPLFNNMSAGEPADDPYFHYVEYEDLLVVAVDNSQDMITKTTVDKFMALYEKNKPIILILHVPMHVDTLVDDCVKVWSKDLGMGGTGVSAWHPENDVERFYNAVCLDENTPVVAVVAGHVHFNHEDVFPNGVPQYITTTAYTGDCRVITVKGK